MLRASLASKSWNLFKFDPSKPLFAFTLLFSMLCNWGSKGGAVVIVLASHQCDPGSNPGVDAICGLSLLLVLSLAPGGFSPGTPVFPSP